MSDLTTNGSGARGQVEVQPLEATPGLPLSTDVTITSLAPVPASFSLSVSGLEPDWVQVAETVGPIDPGASVTTPLQVTVPVGYPPSTMIGAVSLRDVETGDVLAAADLSVTIGDGSRIIASLEPPDVHGWRSGRLEVVLRNRGRQPTKVNLSGVSNDTHLQVTFEEPSPILPPAKELRIKGRVSTRPFPMGAHRRKPFGVKVQGRGTPTIAEGSLVQRPLLPKKTMKLMVVLGVVALWASAVGITITHLSSHLQKSAETKAVASEPPVAASSAPAGGPVGANAGTPGSGGGGGSGGSTSSAGAAGSSGAGAGGAAGSAASGVRVSGKVTASEPGGVTVTITPTSLTNPNTSNVAPASTSAVLTADVTTAGSGPIGKVYGTAIGSTLNSALTAASTGSPTLTTTTRPDGAWAVTGLKAPGTYLVTFSKAGFSTRSYLLTTTSSGTTLELNAAIAPGNGSLSGDITGPGGHLGGVTVTITDGTVTLSTRTPTVGADIGQWALSGLTTPDHYLVTASKTGYGTVTTTVNLGASGSASGVDLKMKEGVASITGKVVSVGQATGIGGIKVSATDGSVTETATTVTTGDIGAYTLPNLAIPGTYALTVSGTGWVTQTQKVDLKANTTIGASLTQTGADVVGNAYDSNGNGIGAAGVTLSDGKNTYKTLTQSTTPVGSFDFGQVPAGNYVLTIAEYGYTSASQQVTVTSGQISTVSLVLNASSGTSVNTGIIQGTVNDLFNSTGLANIPVYIDGNLGATTGSTGNYQINSVTPGVHTITAEPPSTLNYSAASVRVNVPLGGTVIAPVISLPRLDTLSGTVTSGAGTGGIAGASVVLSTSTGVTPSGPSGNTGIVTTTTAPAPSGSSGASGPTGATGSTGVSATGSTTTSSSGTYSLTGLQSGNYEIVVSASGYETQTVDVTLGVDENLSQNVVLTLAPDFNVVTFASTGGGGLSQAAGVCVTVTGSGYSETELTSATAAITFTPLSAGVSYTATFWQPSGSTGSVNSPPPSPCPQNQPQIGTAPPYTFTAQLNNSSVYTAVIAPQLPGLSVSLTYQYEIPVGTSGAGTTVDCPVVATTGAPEPTPAGESLPFASCPDVNHLPAVTVTGIVGYTPSTNGTLGTPETSSPIDATAPPSGSTSDTWTFASSAFSSLVSQQVSISVSGTSTPFESTSETITLSTTNDTPTIILVPTPITVVDTGLPSGTTVTINPSSIPINSDQNGTSPATITATDSAGNLEWGDSLVGAAGLAEPGVYDLSASAPGYEQSGGIDSIAVGVDNYVYTQSGGIVTITDPGTLTAGVTTSAVLGLNQETTLVVSISNWTQYDSLSAPTVYLLYNGLPVSSGNGGAVTVTDSTTSVTTSSASQQLSGLTDTATFTYLSPKAEANEGSGNPGYEVAVVAPGYQTYFDTLGSLSSTSMNVTAPLVEEGALNGNVLGVLDPTVTPVTSSNLAGVTVTATLASGSACTAPSDEPNSGYTTVTPPATIQATTNSAGFYTLTGSSSIYTSGSPVSVDGGLCPGDTYNLTMTIPGYGNVTPSSNPITVAAGNVTVAPQTLDANPFLQEIDISGPASGVVISASNSLGENFVCQEELTSEPVDAPSQCSVPTGAALANGANFAILVYPTSYTYAISAPNYQTVFLSAISYTADEAALNQPISTTPLTVSLQAEQNTIEGTVTYGTSAMSDGLQIGLYGATTNTLVTGTGITNPTATSGGSYSFTNVPGGTYYVKPSPSTGYADSVTPANFNTAYPFTTVNNIAVQATPPTTVTVDVATTANDPNLANASVTLSKYTGGTAACANTSVEGGQTLLLAGQGLTTQSVNTGSGPTYSVSFTNLTPDYYQLTVAGTNMPPQALSAPFAICPTTSPSTPITLPTYTVQEGEIAGAVALAPASSTTPTVNVTPVLGGTATTPAVICTTPLPSSSCSFTSYTTLGDTYTLTASLTGYTPSPTSLSVSTTVGTPNKTNQDLALDLIPTATGISPGTGNPVGGDTVTITGTGFVIGATTVDFGGTTIPAGQVDVASSTSLSVTSPSGAGAANVSVSTAGGTSTNQTFDYVPTVTGLSPSSGPTAGGTTVTLTGTGFVNGATTVDFGGTTIPVGSVNFISSTSVSVSSPSGTAGTATVSATTAGGTSGTQSFTYLSVPSVTGLSPNSGPTAGGTTVTLTGTGFVNGATTVDFGGTTIPVGSVNFISSTSVSVSSPNNSAGAVTVSATTAGGTSGTQSFTYLSVPSVTGLSPNSGPTAGGTTVTLTGTGFVNGATTVDFGGTTIPVGSVNFISSTSVSVSSPNNSAGAVTVSATTAGGTSGTQSFTYVSGPTVTGLSPSSGSPAGGDTVTLTGTGFVNGATTVDFGGTTIPAGSVNFISSTSVSVSSPAGAGTANVSATTTGGTSGNQTFSYVPTATGLSPSSGGPAGGDTVTITGTGFVNGATTVDFGGTTIPASSVNFISSTSVSVSSSAGAGTANVSVTTAGGTSGNETFSYVPTLTSLSPATGATDGGDVVTLNGTGFVSGATTVDFGGTTIPAGSVTFISSTSVSVFSPPGATGAVNVSATTAGGTSGTQSYTYS